MVDKQAQLNDLSHTIIRAAIQVHKALSPGLLENAYLPCLAHELRSKKLSVNTEVYLPITYKDLVIEKAYRIDLIIENKIIVELKACKEISSIHHAQLHSYLQLSNLPLGLLINFHEQKLTDGIKRIVTEQYKK